MMSYQLQRCMFTTHHKMAVKPRELLLKLPWIKSCSINLIASNVTLWWRWRSLANRVCIQQTLCSDRPWRETLQPICRRRTRKVTAGWLKAGRQQGSAAALYCDGADSMADWPTNGRGKEQTVTFTLLYWSESQVWINRYSVNTSEDFVVCKILFYFIFLCYFHLSLIHSFTHPPCICFIFIDKVSCFSIIIYWFLVNYMFFVNGHLKERWTSLINGLTLPRLAAC